MPTPRRESSTGPTTAATYTLECKLLRAYRALYKSQIGDIWHPATRRTAQVAALGGLDRAATRNGYAESRLTESLPEVIQRLTAQQQPEVAALLLCESPDLTQVVAKLVQLERNINYRDDDPRLSINDDGRLKAAGMGHLSKAIYGNLPKLGEPLVLTPWQPRAGLRTKKRRPHKPHVHRTRRYVGYPQLSLGFPGGEVTLAAL